MRHEARYIPLIVLGLALACLLPLAAGPAALAASPAGRLEITIGQTRILELPEAAKRVSVGKETIADVVVIGPRQLYLVGREVGSTTVTAWDRNDRVLALYEVRVARDLSRLKQNLYEILPHEPVEVRDMEGTVVLSGRVSSLQAKAQAEDLARALMAPKDHQKSLHQGEDTKHWVTSVLEVGGHQQVQIKVQIAEVNRTVTNRMNVNVMAFNPLTGDYLFTLLGGLIRPFETTVGPNGFSTKFDLTTNLTGFGGFKVGGAHINTFLDILTQNNLAKILAEPTLVATSGQPADFLAGGEFPIPVPQKDNITIEFKKFGVQLAFTPEVLKNGNLRMTVAPEVSDLDFKNALRIEGYVVPGLTTRKAKTQLELKDGQSFAMAGLFRDDITQVVAKVPLLGDLPILGALFRSSEFISNKTELVIVVTPQIVRPGVAGAPRLPTDGVKPPSDLDFFLMGGMTETPKIPAPLPRSLGEMEGSFGHEPVY
jgi:pilus assembly protein CpaC